MFHVGQKVVCINGDFPIASEWRDAVAVFPVRGQIYTVRELGEDSGEQLMRLHEIINSSDGWHCEPWFKAHRFRPVRETSIDIFTAMLAPQPKEPANA